MHVRRVLILLANLISGVVASPGNQLWAQPGIVDVQITATQAAPQSFLLISKRGVVRWDHDSLPGNLARAIRDTAAADTLRLVTPVALVADLRIGGITLIPYSGQLRADLLLYNGSTMNAVADKIVMGREGKNIFVRGMKR